MPHSNVSGLDLIRVTPLTPREINRLNRRFWKKQSRLATTLATDSNGFEETRNSGPELSRQPPMKVRDVQLMVPAQQNRHVVGKAAVRSLRPKQYVATHYVTRKLECLGVTKEHLESIRFRGPNEGRPFDLWSCTWPPKMPVQAIPFVKSYCALKWLILENPPYSRDKEDAWRFVAEMAAAPTFAIGARARNAQSKRAKNPRGKITTDGRTLGQMIAKLASRRPREYAKELWTHLRAGLEEEGLNPVEVVNLRNPQEVACEYDFRRRRKQLSFR